VVAPIKVHYIFVWIVEDLCSWSFCKKKSKIYPELTSTLTPALTTTCHLRPSCIPKLRRVQPSRVPNIHHVRLSLHHVRLSLHHIRLPLYHASDQPLRRAERPYLRHQQPNRRARWSNSQQRCHEYQLLLNGGDSYHIHKHFLPTG
jgi:hypothetical protein